MWYRFVEKERFLGMIYSEIPELKNVNINKIEVNNQLNNANIIFEMPFYCDNEPEKWKKQKFNTVVVNLRCCNINNMKLIKNSKNYKATIQIEQLNSLLAININGDFTAQFTAEAIMIEEIGGYQDSIENSIE